MKNWLLLIFLLVACSDAKAPTVSNKHPEITTPEALIVGEIHKPLPSLPSREELLKPVFDTAALMEQEQLPFDEPKTEIGQQDGSLRAKWEQAYFNKVGSYWFNDDKYYVYGKGKSPRPPEVCADFIVDLLERTSGTWYANNKRVIGNLDIRGSMKKQGLYARRVNELVDYFKSQPENFKFLFAVDDPQFAPTNYWGGPQVTPADGEGGLKEFLLASGVQVGDIIIISGRAPWDHGKEIHNHSMIVSSLKNGEVDTIIGNDAWVREKKLTIEVARAPKRKVKYIVRLTNEFLLSLRKHE
jgi:hypothetical protein